MTIALRQRPLARVVQGIVQAANGTILEVNDMSYLYQDAAGTIPVTAVEQPVGKIIDKSGNGNHATQSVTASRPVLSARYNLLTKTEDFSSGVWAQSNAGYNVNALIAPNGTLTADKLIPTTTSGVHQFYYNDYAAFTFPVGTVLTESVYMNAGNFTQGFINFWQQSDRYAYFDLVACTVISAGSGITATISDAGNGWRKCTISAAVINTNAVSIRFGPAIGGNAVFTGDGVSGIYLWGADLRIGTAVGPYQRVNTATDYDTDERYFKKYLRFDAVDDYLNLPFMNLYGGGAASIICARDAVSQATDTYIISERSTTDIDPKYLPSRQLASAGNMDAYISDDAGTAVLDTVGSPFSGVANAVIRSIVDSGNNLKLFKNGVLAANDNYTRSGTLTLNNTTIGASVSTTTSNYASMKLYGLIVTKSALTDAQRIQCERHQARKSGVLM